MSGVAAIIGLGLETVVGWLMVRLTEGRTPVLLQWERWVVGFVLGGTLTMYVATMLQILGLIRFTLMPMLSMHVLLAAALGIAWYRRRKRWEKMPEPTASPSPPMRPGIKILLAIIMLWTLGKILASAALLTLPPYYDDTLKYWNLRGKIFLAAQELSLSMDPGNHSEVSGLASYPSTIPLLKTWLSLLAGTWVEWLVNLPHLLWYMAALLLIYATLRRYTARVWALLGSYVLGSLPLFLMQASGAYADSHVAVHVLIAVAMIYHAAKTKNTRDRLSFFRIGAISAALLVFTKSEALLMHLPTLIVILGALLLTLSRKKAMDASAIRTVLLTYAMAIGIVALPWIAYKLFHSLPFGNAKPIPTQWSFQPGILRGIGINLFLEGNWNLLPAIFLGLILSKWRRAFFTPAAILICYILLFMIGQLPIFLYTGLSIEAVNQTAYARGVLQIAPIAVLSVMLLVHQSVHRFLNSARTRS